MAKTREEQFKELQEKVKQLKKTPVREKMNRPEVEHLLSINEIGESGRPEAIEDKEAVAAFQRKEKEEVLHVREKSVDIPNWLKAEITNRKSPQAVLKYLMERVRRAPSKNALQLAQQIINDIGRKKGGSKVFKGIVTSDTVREIIELSNRK
jgi:arginine utilization protein RocB